MDNNEWNLEQANEAEKDGCWLKAAYFYLQSSKPDKALKAILKATKKDYYSGTLCLELAKKDKLALLQQEEAFGTAIKHLIGLGVDVDSSLGDCLRELGEYNLAGIEYEKNAVKNLGSHDSWASEQYLKAAAVFEKAGLKQDTDRCLDSARQINGDEALASWWIRHAIEMRRCGQFEQAAEFYQKQAALESGTCPIWTYDIAADMFGRAERAARAAEALERAATLARATQIRAWPFLDRAAHLYVRGSAPDRAAALFDQCGRKARAERARGARVFDLEEAKEFSKMLGLCPVEDSRRAFGEIKLYGCKAAEEAYHKGDLAGASSAWKVKLLDEDHLLWNYEHWYWIPELYLKARDQPAYRRALREVENYFRGRGWWYLAAEMYLYIQDDLYDEFERVCIEEDELEVAALWYEQANMPERAAKMYDLMGQGGKSGKAQAEGAKQKPLDTAEPKSDSTEELKGEDSGQPVCAQCGAEVKAHWTVCPKCDTDLQQRKCRNCGEPLEPDWKRCPVCKIPI